jgi:hypothetical protein
LTCNSAFSSLVFYGSSSTTVSIEFDTTSACVIGTGGIVTGNILAIQDSTFTLTSATVNGPVRLIASGSVDSVRLVITRSSTFKARCDVTAPSALAVAGFGVAAPFVNNTTVTVADSTVGCSRMTVVLPFSVAWGSGVGVGVLGIASGNRLGGNVIGVDVAVLVTNSTIFGPASATANTTVGTASAAVGDITVEGSVMFVVGVGIAYTTDAFNVTATVTVFGSTVDLGSFKYQDLGRGVGAVGLAVRTSQATLYRVNVTDPIVRVDAIVFPLHVMDFASAVGVASLHQTTQLPIVQHVTLRNCNVTVGPVTAPGDGGLVNHFLAAGITATADSSTGSTPGVMHAELINSTLTTDVVLANTDIRYAVNGFGIIGYFHPTQSIVTRVENSTVNAGAIIGGNVAALALISGTGIVMSDMTNVSASVEVIVSTVRSSTCTTFRTHRRLWRTQCLEPASSRTVAWLPHRSRFTPSIQRCVSPDRYTHRRVKPAFRNTSEASATLARR